MSNSGWGELVAHVDAPKRTCSLSRCCPWWGRLDGQHAGTAKTEMDAFDFAEQEYEKIPLTLQFLLLP